MQQLKNIGSHTGNIDAVFHHGYKMCGNCGRHHAFTPRENCPAHKDKCHNCGRTGHWKSMCCSRRTQNVSQEPRPGGRSSSRNRGEYRPRGRGRGWSRGRGGGQGRTVNATQHDRGFESDVESEFDQMSFESVEAVECDVVTSSDKRDEIYVSLDVRVEGKTGTHKLKAKMDTGAQGNILPVRIFRRMFPSKLDADGLPKPGVTTARKTRLSAYNGTNIAQYGTIIIPCRFENSEWESTEFFVVESDGPGLVGLLSCRSLKLVTLHCEVQKSKEKIRDKEHLRTNISRAILGHSWYAPRKIETHAQGTGWVKSGSSQEVLNTADEMKTELNQMESIGVITRVIEPTDWVSNIAYSRKDNGKLRICLCPTQLNRELKRTYHKVPTVEEITHKLSGAQVLSKLDARHGYWSIVLDDESSMLTTFNTPFGRYRYLRLPFGLSVSGDIFQEKMDQILEQCPGTMSIADDVVFGKDESEHDNNLHNLMEVAS